MAEALLSASQRGWLLEVREHMTPLRARATELRRQSEVLEAQADEREASVFQAIVKELGLKGTLKLVRGSDGLPEAIRHE